MDLIQIALDAHGLSFVGVSVRISWIAPDRRYLLHAPRKAGECSDFPLSIRLLSYPYRERLFNTTPIYNTIVFPKNQTENRIQEMKLTPPCQGLTLTWRGVYLLHDKKHRTCTRRVLSHLQPRCRQKKYF